MLIKYAVIYGQKVSLLAVNILVIKDDGLF